MRTPFTSTVLLLIRSWEVSSEGGIVGGTELSTLALAPVEGSLAHHLAVKHHSSQIDLYAH